MLELGHEIQPDPGSLVDHNAVVPLTNVHTAHLGVSFGPTLSSVLVGPPIDWSFFPLEERSAGITAFRPLVVRKNFGVALALKRVLAIEEACFELYAF